MTQNTADPTDMETARNAIETLYRAFNTGEPNLLDVVLAEDWRDLPLAPGQQPGCEGFKPVISAFCAAFADVAFTPEEMVVADGRAAVRLTLT